jgi:hypothetical protein
MQGPAFRNSQGLNLAARSGGTAHKLDLRLAVNIPIDPKSSAVTFNDDLKQTREMGHMNERLPE